MNKQRLAQMADLLEEVAAGTWKPTRSGQALPAPDRFDLRHWYNSRGCGTAGCAVGHAAFDTRFPEFNVSHDGALTVAGSGREVNIWDDVAAIFGIDGKSAIDLFDADSYATEEETTPDDVAGRIREMIE